MESQELQKAVKIVLKYEIRSLLSRLAETGEEWLVFTVSTEDRTCGQFGSDIGSGYSSGYILDQFKKDFLEFCTERRKDHIEQIHKTLPEYCDTDQVFLRSFSDSDVNSTVIERDKSEIDETPNKTPLLWHSEKISIQSQHEELNVTKNSQLQYSCKEFDENKESFDDYSHDSSHIISETDLEKFDPISNLAEFVSSSNSLLKEVPFTHKTTVEENKKKIRKKTVNEDGNSSFSDVPENFEIGDIITKKRIKQEPQEDNDIFNSADCSAEPANCLTEQNEHSQPSLVSKDYALNTKLQNERTQFFKRMDMKSCFIKVGQSYKCLICDKLLTGRSSPVFHWRSHFGDKRYRCDICNKTFTHPSNMKSHRRTLHTGENLERFKCTYCGRGFQRGDRLKYHVLKVHTNLQFQF